MSQQLITIISGVNVLVSVAVVCLIMGNWGQPYMRHMASLFIMSTLYSMGYFIRVTAPTPEVSLLAYKLSCCGGPYMGPFATLLGIEYCGWSMRKNPAQYIIFVIPVFITILVLTESPLYMSNISYVPFENVLRLRYDAGPFYLVNFLYAIVLNVISTSLIIWHFFRSRRKGLIYKVIFPAMVFLPIAAKLAGRLGLFPEYDFFYVTSTIMGVAFYLYYMRFQEGEWRTLGRDAVVMNSPNAIVTVNGDSTIIDVNRMFRNYFPSFPCTPSVTPFSGFVQYLKDRSVNSIPQNLFDGLETVRLELDQGEFTMTNSPPNQAEPQTFTIRRQTHTEGGKILGQTFIVTDVSAYRAMTQDLIQTRSANTAKSQFLAFMSHEIRTPMNVILGMSDLIRTDNLDEGQRNFFEDIKKMSRSLLQIINDILDFSKIESGKMELSPVHFNLENLFRNLNSLHGFMAEQKGLEFHSSFEDSAPRIVYGDDVRIRQILTNILGNAVKYTHEGFVRFTVKGVRENGTDYTAFVVEDSGNGIKKEDFSKLFDWYEQADIQKNRAINGTGLGLPITKRFTGMMKGRIDIQSEYGKGSAFTVLLPLEEGDPDKLEQTPLAGTVIAAADIQVLVVDDNAINLKVALAYLERHGIRADAAASGAEALEKIRDKKYDLVFMDHMMPEMDGIETTARIREWEAHAAAGGDVQSTSLRSRPEGTLTLQPETVEANDGMSFGSAETPQGHPKGVPIIALSANAVTGAGELFLESGMDDFLYKPIAQGELNRLLGKWLPKDRITIRAAEELPGVMENRPAPATGMVINRAAGLANAVGNERFYQQLLSEFKAGHGGDIRKIRTALDAPDYRAAYRLAHTLKSIANVIGAGKLGAAALTVEKALRKTDRLPPREMLETLEREFEAVMAELASIAPESPPKTYSTDELDLARALAFTRKLEPLLVTRNAGSLRLREDIREILGPADEMCGTLINQIENYDFAEAVDTLNKIKEKMVN